jgi:hypothetical protein
MLLPPGGLAHGAGTLLSLHNNVRDFEQTAIEVMTHRNQQTPLDNGTSAVKVCASTLGGMHVDLAGKELHSPWAHRHATRALLVMSDPPDQPCMAAWHPARGGPEVWWLACQGTWGHHAA